MATFLVNDKMNPELAARVHASVTGRARKRAPQRRGTRRVLFLRLGVALALLTLVTSLVVSFRASRQELAAGRASLAARVAEHSSRLVPGSQGLAEQATAWLLKAAGPYEGDRVAPSLRQAGLESTLARGTLYVRAELDAVRQGQHLTRIAEDSFQDSLLLCLVSPPTSRSESALMKRVLVAQGGGAPLVQATRSAHRLHDALAAMTLLGEGWQQRITRASLARLEVLDALFDEDLLAQGVEAANARVLVYVLDEPKQPGTPTELDGATEHPVRVGIVDLDRSQLLLRARSRVDPEWVAESRRARFARALTDCRLAFDLRAAVRAGGTSPGE